jgi:hypothetical protein
MSWTLLTVVSVLSLLGSLFALIFRSVRQRAKWTAFASFVVFVIIVVGAVNAADDDARQKGFLSQADFSQAKESGFTDPGKWKDQRENVEAAKQRAISEANAKVDELLRFPAQQVALIRAIERARIQFKNGSNDIQRMEVRKFRANAICSNVSSSIERWIGKISELSINSDGRSSASITIGKNLKLKTWNNALSDIGSDTPIDSSSSVYRTLLDMKVGQVVRFDGEFIPRDRDCYSEGGMTFQDSIESPEFLVRFSRVDAVEEPK